MLGAGIKLIRGIRETSELPQKIQELESELREPIVRKYSGARRFEIASQLAEAHFLRSAQQDPNSLPEAKIKWRQTMQTEFENAQPDLEKEYATKADVAVVGIAMKELALNLDEHVNAFRREAGESIQMASRGFDEATSAQLSRLEKETALKADEAIQSAVSHAAVSLGVLRGTVIALGVGLILSWGVILLLLVDPPQLSDLREQWFPRMEASR